MSIISDLIGGGIKGIGEAAKNVIDSLNAPKEKAEQAKAAITAEIDRHLEAVAAQEGEIQKAFLADVASSRDANVKIQESDKASWLAKNVSYVIDLFVMLIWGCMTVYIALRALNLLQATRQVDFSVILGIYAAVSTQMGTVLNFHRGSSKGSEDKQKTLDKMATASKN